MKEASRRRAGLRSWCWLLRHFILPLGDVAFGQKMLGRLRFLEEAQWWDRERLDAHQDSELARLIRIVYEEIPFYRELMVARRLTPDDLRSPRDLVKLPIVTKDMLRAGYPGLTTRDTGKKTYEVSTSGSTGKNFRVREDAETAGWYRSTFLLMLEWAGWLIGEPHLQTGMTIKRSLDRMLKDALLRCHYFSAFDLTDAHLDCCLEEIERHKLEHVWGYPGSLFYIARRAAQQGWNRPLRSVVTWGDNLHTHYRETIEKAFQTRVYDTYGCAEGMHIAGQCAEGNGYHEHNLDVIVEYLDEDGVPVRSGEAGNVVLTRLHPGPMPLVRYKVGDLAVRGGDDPCPCGRSLSRMASVEGRDTDVVVTPGGNRLIVHFFTGIIEFYHEIDCFQVIQESPEAIILRIVPGAGFSSAVVDRLLAELREKGTADLKIIVDVVAEVALPPGGKRRFVISRLDTSATGAGGRGVSVASQPGTG